MDLGLFSIAQFIAQFVFMFYIRVLQKKVLIISETSSLNKNCMIIWSNRFYGIVCIFYYCCATLIGIRVKQEDRIYAIGMNGLKVGRISNNFRFAKNFYESISKRKLYGTCKYPWKRGNIILFVHAWLNRGNPVFYLVFNTKKSSCEYLSRRNTIELINS